MAWVAPVLRSVGGDTGEYTTTAASSSRDFTVQANAGDLVCVTVLTSYFAYTSTGVSGGGITFTARSSKDFTNPYGSCYVYSGTSATTQTFTLSVSLKNNLLGGTIPGSHIRYYVFGSHGGFGAVGSFQGSSAAVLSLTQTAQQSAFIMSAADGDAAAATGTWYTDAGASYDGVVFTGNAKYWSTDYRNSTGLTSKRLGASSGVSSKMSVVAMEIKGIQVDTTPPSAVSSLTALLVSPTSFKLNWSATSDDTGVVGYRIYNNGVQIAAVGNVLTYTHSGLTPGTTYSYTVKAIDAAGNLGGASPTQTVKTPFMKFLKGENIPALYLGSTQVSAVYFGTSQIWP